MARLRHVFSHERATPPPPLLDISPAERHHMIEEAAYYRWLKRGASAGHDLDDWLAAEDDFEGAKRRRPLAHIAQPSLFTLQQGGAEEAALRRVTRQHARRDSHLVESAPEDEAPEK